ncbi:hypothetical protein FJZ18_03520 [Candidatus Pacearchaeota archaeon]|nr:hypothetical protein [Candidatus Pacearchaeota archaeon]
MEEDKLIHERKKLVIDFLKRDILFSSFLTIAAISLSISIWVKSGLFNPNIGFAPIAYFASIAYAWNPGDWFLLALLASLSAACVYYRKDKYAFYPLFAWIVWISIKIRTLPMSINPGTGKPGLWDISRDTWTLGPDLDPFLFLRWMKDIVANGSLFEIDPMRYVPIGFNTSEELILHPILMAWFHKLASAFGSTSVEYSAIIYPVFMFALGIITFFFLVREMFRDELGENTSSAIALFASFILTVIPVLLPRTVAGIPEKEVSALPFLFLAFYFFLLAWKAKENLPRYLYAILSAITTAAMALVWGGYIYIYITIGLAATVLFLVGQTHRHSVFIYGLWLLGSMGITAAFTKRYTFMGLLTSTTTGIATFILVVMVVDFALRETPLKKFIERGKLSHLPNQLIAIGIALVCILAGSLALGPNFIQGKVQNVVNQLVTPTTDRLGVTVAENRQPFFDEWAGNFGPSFYSLFTFLTFNWFKVSQSTASSWSQIPLFFWLFFFGSVLLFFSMVKSFSIKERLVMTGGYLGFLFALIFSRYRGDSVLNGTSSMSLLLYGLGFLLLVFVLGWPGMAKTAKTKLYYQIAGASFLFYMIWILYFKDSTFFMILSGMLIACFGAFSLIGISKEERFKTLNPGTVMLFAFFFLSIISARGAVRLIMVLAIPAAIIVAYLVITSIKAYRVKEKGWKIIAIIIMIMILVSSLFAAYNFYQASRGGAQGSIPYSYTFQWQKAMGWVRDNTPQNAVFGHWWDYGYWLQSIGDRATVLDGGNAIPYWNFLMGRYALTAPPEEQMEVLSYLYTHKTTHFLIDSSDIGKYTAFSSIGSDLSGDRRSWIQTMTRSPVDFKEVKNGTKVFYYPGAQKYQSIIPLDGDILYTQNQTNGTSTVSILADRSGIIGISIEMDPQGNLRGPAQGIYVYRQKDQQKEESFPLRYAFYNDTFYDFGSGIDAGVFFMNNLQPNGERIGLEKDGALLYLSSKTVRSQLARLYLYKEDNLYFKLVHTQDSPIVEQIRPQAVGTDIGDIVFYQGVQGPIRIWEINYPDDIQTNSTYLQKNFQDLRLAR